MSDPDYICDYCSRSFTRKYNLQTHIENCHLNLTCHCEICDQDFGSPTGLFLHLNRGHNSSGQPFPECDICGRVFTRRQNIISHMETVHLLNNSYFPCHICNKTFTTARNMKRHMKVLHDPDVQYLMCNECDRGFKGKNSLIAHIESNHHSNDVLKCHVCAKRYTSKKNLKRHLETCHGQKGEFKCVICPKVYTSSQSLRRHSRTQHLMENHESYTCEYCYKVLYGRHNLESHVLNHHQHLDETFESKYDFFCEICNMTFKKEYLLRQHIKSTHTFQQFYDYCKQSLIKSDEKLQRLKKMKESNSRQACEYCPRDFGSACDLRDHMRLKHDRDYCLATCNVCFQKFFSKETLKEHKKTCVPPKNVNSCSQCDKLFTDVSSLEFHLRIFHPQAQMADSNILDESEMFKCIHCEQVYHNERSLKQHMNLKHASNDPVMCKICKKTLENKYYLAYHIKVYHTAITYWKCDYCDKQFTCKRNIRRHIEYTHLGIQRHKCLECATLFKEKRSLRKHVRIKHPDSATFPQCHICEKRFESAKSCKTHLKLQHSLDVNTHPCEFCSISFDTLEGLNSHLSANHLTEDELYKCQECNLVFKGQEKFNKHFETFHSELPSDDKVLPRCIICMKDFSARKTLKRHIKKFHSDFDADELAAYGSRKRVFSVDCMECVRSFNDDFYSDVHLKLKNSRESVVFECGTCNSSYNSLEFAIHKYKQSYDASQSKLYLSELCTTQMSEDSDSVDMKPESTTGYIKTEPFEAFEKPMEPESTSEIKDEPFIKEEIEYDENH